VTDTTTRKPRGPAPLVRLPLAPLQRDMTAAELGVMIGRTGNIVRSWNSRGGVPIHLADTIAVKAGFHPSEIWGDAFYGALAVAR